MANINSIKTEMKASKMLKTCMVGIVAAAGIGFISVPAKADEINQDGVQTNVQKGGYNTSVQQTDQKAKAETWQNGYGHYNRHSDRNVIRQGGDQLNQQEGYDNTSVQQTNQDAIRQERWFRY